jgi:Cu/Ag efflux pump CusA
MSNRFRSLARPGLGPQDTHRWVSLAAMALNLGMGSEQYAPLARTIIRGLMASVILTMYIVPAAVAENVHLQFML